MAGSKSKVLFILKQRSNPYGNTSSDGKTSTSGLKNSSLFLVEMLKKHGIEVFLEEVVDNNDIDKLVFHYKPTHVIIEALWVVPEKFDILQKLHPFVKWIVRCHSELSFLSQEGVAIEWIFEYLKYKNVYVALNSDRAHTELVDLANDLRRASTKIIYLPNYYPIDRFQNLPHQLSKKSTIDIGCFGAIRPLKNQFVQAVAAIEFAKREGLNLRFHINGTRVEQVGGEALKNIRELFKIAPSRYQLVEHSWLSHSDFIKLVCTMDLGMQLSFTESFNIVTADFVSNGIPVVVSDEISWINKKFQCSATNIEEIVETMQSAMKWKKFPLWNAPNQTELKNYCLASRKIWISYFN